MNSQSVSKNLHDKVIRRLIPFLFLLYLVAFIDRVNVGFAKLRMAGDLGLSDADFGVGAGIFFLGYFLLEVPSNLLLHRIGAKRAIARIVLFWGLISMAMAAIQDKWSFYALRFLLGMGEAGFFPGVILYLTYWFPSQLRAKTTALFMTALAISGVIGGPVSGWIMENLDGWLDLHGWQWLFVLEGAPAVLLGLVSLRVLDDGPRTARWLTGAERSQLLRDLAADQSLQAAGGTHQHFSRSLKNPRLWLLAIVYLLLATGIYGVSFWLPQIVHDLELGGIFLTGLISAIPYAFATLAMVGISQHSDRRQERRWHIAASAVAGGAGLALCAASLHSPLPALAGLTLATSGIFAALAIFWALPTAFLSGTAAAGGIALINSIAALGGYFGPSLLGWVKQTTGSVASGLFVIAGCLLLAAGLVVSLGETPRTPR